MFLLLRIHKHFSINFTCHTKDKYTSCKSYKSYNAVMLNIKVNCTCAFCKQNLLNQCERSVPVGIRGHLSIIFTHLNIVDREAEEIMHLVASVHPSVHPSVRL